MKRYNVTLNRSARSIGRAMMFSMALLVLIGTSSANAQKGGKSKSKPAKGGGEATTATGAKDASWLIRWNGGLVTLPEFEQAYERMNDRRPYATSFDSLKDFLSVYSDYRLKLEDAKTEGIDKDPKIQAEIKGYRDILAGPYVLEKELTEPAIKQMFERRKVEVHVAHFLAGVKNWNKPEDTLKAYKKALRALEMLDAGYPISYVAMSPIERGVLVNLDPNALNRKIKMDTSNMETWAGSDDKTTAKVGGELGWFTGGMTVRAFEDAVYAMQPGEISKVPLKTRYGYHIIELVNRRPRVGGVHVAHILISTPKGTSDTASSHRRADSLLKVIRNGASFEEVARESSDEKFSAVRGGDMDTINHEDKKTEPSFDAAAYNLKDGEVSDVVRTSFGFHIIKRLGTMPPATFEQERDRLKKFYKQYFFDEEKAKRLVALRHDYNLTFDSSTINFFMKRVDSTRTSIDSFWAKRITNDDRGVPIYRLGGEAYTIGMLVDSLNGQPGTALARSAVYEMINKSIDDKSMQLLSRNIGTQYPEFEQIMEDYKRGIILFELENKRVWSQVVPDSAKEQVYYAAHTAKFMWPERVDISEIFVTSDSVAKQLYKRIINGENFDTIASKYTERPGYKQRAGHWGLLQKEENELARRAFNFVVDEVKEPFSFQGGFSIVKLNRRDLVHAKTFAEARQEVASQYQDDRASELRTEWSVNLRKKYNRQINEPLITKQWKMNHGN